MGFDFQAHSHSCCGELSISSFEMTHFECYPSSEGGVDAKSPVRHGAEPLEARAREIARRENRSLSNVVENALGVSHALPKDLRDQLVARLSTGGSDDVALREAAREMMFALARRRYEEARTPGFIHWASRP